MLSKMLSMNSWLDFEQKARSCWLSLALEYVNSELVMSGLMFRTSLLVRVRLHSGQCLRRQVLRPAELALEFVVLSLVLQRGHNISIYCHIPWDNSSGKLFGKLWFSSRAIPRGFFRIIWLGWLITIKPYIFKKAN